MIFWPRSSPLWSADIWLDIGSSSSRLYPPLVEVLEKVWFGSYPELIVLDLGYIFLKMLLKHMPHSASHQTSKPATIFLNQSELNPVQEHKVLRASLQQQGLSLRFYYYINCNDLIVNCSHRCCASASLHFRMHPPKKCRPQCKLA